MSCTAFGRLLHVDQKFISNRNENTNKYVARTQGIQHQWWAIFPSREIDDSNILLLEKSDASSFEVAYPLRLRPIVLNWISLEPIL